MTKPPLTILVAFATLLCFSSCTGSRGNSSGGPQKSSEKTSINVKITGEEMKNTENRGTNRLALEKNPYLLQHASNPVDWYPWGDEAFEKAARENLPIFLSIGYSTCHWCHVMEKESFENPEIAKILNKYFVAIKVDREERPDIDAVYMSVCQALTGSGGWPLTIIMTPEKKPFFAGTYLPPDDRFIGQNGTKGLKSFLPEIAGVWTDRRDEIYAAADRVVAAVSAKTERATGTTVLNDAILEKAFSILSDTHDDFYGGFGMQGPKFPTPHTYSFLLRFWNRTGNRRVLEIASHSLKRIANGGIHDQIGGGFARYSTDREWLVPHFEKMLYDQALLARAYLETFQATGNPEFADTSHDIFEYVLRDLSSPEGAFYSAEDADSEGEEGKFYVWTEKEIDAVLSDSFSPLFKEYYGITHAGNFEHGTSIIHISTEIDKFVADKHIDKADFLKDLSEARKKLFDVRNKRIHPHLDDKILTSWNGLMISALAYGARVLNEPEYAIAAQKAASFILREMYSGGVLYRRYRDGETAVPGFMDDYAFFADGLLDLYEATYDTKYLNTSKELTDIMLKKFSGDAGSLAQSSDNHEKLIKNVVEAYDGAEPSGNSVAAGLLIRLGRLTTKQNYTRRGVDIIESFSKDISSYPPGYTRMLCALDFHLGPSMEVVFAGTADNDVIKTFINIYNGVFLPNAVSVYSDPSNPVPESLVPFAYSKEMIDGKPAAYVCQNYSCKFPTTNPDKFKALLKSKN